MSDSLTVQLLESDHRVLRELSAETGENEQTVIHNALEKYRRELIHDRADAAYQRLRADPKAWAEELEERAVWDAALGDNLENDE